MSSKHWSFDRTRRELWRGDGIATYLSGDRNNQCDNAMRMMGEGTMRYEYQQEMR